MKLKEKIRRWVLAGAHGVPKEDYDYYVKHSRENTDTIFKRIEELRTENEMMKVDLRQVQVRKIYLAEKTFAIEKTYCGHPLVYKHQREEAKDSVFHDLLWELGKHPEMVQFQFGTKFYPHMETNDMIPDMVRATIRIYMPDGGWKDGD